MTKKNKFGLYKSFIFMPSIKIVKMNCYNLNQNFTRKTINLDSQNSTKTYCNKNFASTQTDTYNFETTFNNNKTNPLLKPLFFNGYFDKNRLKLLVTWSLKNCGQTITIDLLENLKTIGFKYATRAGISLGIDDLKIPPTKNKFIVNADRNIKKTQIHYQQEFLTGIEKFQHLIDTWHRTSEILKQNVISHFKFTNIFNPVYMMAFSGARGNVSQVRQLVGMRGLMSDPKGHILDFPIKSNFREGLTLTEYIISCYGARKGLVDTALKTANSGYLTRRLVDVSHHIIVFNFDCKTKRGVILNTLFENKKIIIPLQTRLVGRILAENVYSPVHKKLNKNIKSIVLQSQNKLVLKKHKKNYGWNVETKNKNFQSSAENFVNHKFISNKNSFPSFDGKTELIHTKNGTLILKNKILILHQIKKNSPKCVLFFHLLLFYNIKIIITNIQLNVISKTLRLFFKKTKNDFFTQKTQLSAKQISQEDRRFFVKFSNKNIKNQFFTQQTQLFFQYNLKSYYLFYEKDNQFYKNLNAEHANQSFDDEILADSKEVRDFLTADNAGEQVFEQLYIEYNLNIEYLKIFFKFILDTSIYHISHELLGLKNEEISASLSLKISNLKKSVLVRSPLTCEIRNSICQLCYGWGLAYGKLVPLGEAVGVIAAQSIGEPGTQLTMRTFHTGGVFSGDIMSEILAPFDGKILFSNFLQGILIRTSHGKIAFLTKISGSFQIQKVPGLNVLATNTNNYFKINDKDRKNLDNENTVSFKIPSLTILFVRNHELVNKTQLIAEFSSIFTDANQRIQARHNLHAEIDGEIFFKKMVLKIRTNNNQLISRTTCDLGSIWILSGKTCQQPISMNLFSQPGDLIDTNSIAYQYKIVSPYQGMRKSSKLIKNNIQTFTYSSLLNISNQNSIYNDELRLKAHNTQQNKLSEVSSKTDNYYKHVTKNNLWKNNTLKSASLKTDWLEYPLIYFFVQHVQYKKFGYFFKFFVIKQTLFSLNNLRLKNHCFFLFHSFSQQLLKNTNYTTNLFFRSFPRFYQTQTGGNIIYDKFYLNEKIYFGEIFWVPEQILLSNNEANIVLNSVNKFFDIIFFENISKYSLKKEKIKKIIKKNFYFNKTSLSSKTVFSKKKISKQIKKTKIKFNTFSRKKKTIFISTNLLKKQNVYIDYQINMSNNNCSFILGIPNFIHKNESIISYCNSQGKFFNFYSVFNGYIENYCLSTLNYNPYRYSFWSKIYSIQLNNSLPHNYSTKIIPHVSKNQKYKTKKTSFNYRFHQTTFNVNPSLLIFILSKIHLQIKKTTENKKLSIFFIKKQKNNQQKKLKLTKQNVFSLHTKFLRKQFQYFIKNLWENLYAKHINPLVQNKTSFYFYRGAHNFTDYKLKLLKNKQTLFIRKSDILTLPQQNKISYKNIYNKNIINTHPVLIKSNLPKIFSYVSEIFAALNFAELENKFSYKRNKINWKVSAENFPVEKQIFSEASVKKSSIFLQICKALSFVEKSSIFLQNKSCKKQSFVLTPLQILFFKNMFAYYFLNITTIYFTNFINLHYNKKKNESFVQTMQNYQIFFVIFSQLILFQYYTVSNNAFLYSYLYSIKKNKMVQLNFLTKKRIVMLYPQFPWKHFEKRSLKNLLARKFKFYFLANKTRKKTLIINNILYTKNYTVNLPVISQNISQKLSHERENIVTKNAICKNLAKSNTDLQQYFLSILNNNCYRTYRKLKNLQFIHTNIKYYKNNTIYFHKNIQNRKQFFINKNAKKSSIFQLVSKTTHKLKKAKGFFNFLPMKKNHTIQFYVKPGTLHLSVSQINNINNNNSSNKTNILSIDNQSLKKNVNNIASTIAPSKYYISIQLNKKFLTTLLAWKNRRSKLLKNKQNLFFDQNFSKLKASKFCKLLSLVAPNKSCNKQNFSEASVKKSSIFLQICKVPLQNFLLTPNFYKKANRIKIKPGWVYIPQNFKSSIKNHNYIINSGKNLKLNKYCIKFKNINKNLKKPKLFLNQSFANKNFSKFSPVTQTIGFDQYPVYCQCITIKYIFIQKNIYLTKKIYKLSNKTHLKKMYSKFTILKSNNYNNNYTTNIVNKVYNDNFCIKKNFKHYFLLKNWHSLFFFNKKILYAINNTKKIKKNKLHIVYEIFLYKKNLYNTFLKQIGNQNIQFYLISNKIQNKEFTETFFQKIYFLKNKNFYVHKRLVTKNNSKKCIQIDKIILHNFFQHCLENYEVFCNSNKRRMFYYSFTVNLNLYLKKKFFPLSVFCETTKSYLYHIPLFIFTNSNHTCSFNKNETFVKVCKKSVLLKFNFFNITNFLSLKKNYLYKKVFVLIYKARKFSFYNVMQYKNSILTQNSYFSQSQFFLTKNLHYGSKKQQNFAQFSSNNKQNITNLFWQSSSPDFYIRYCFKHQYSKKILFLHSIHVFEYYVCLNMPTYYKYNKIQIKLCSQAVQSFKAPLKLCKKSYENSRYTIGMYLNISIFINLKFLINTDLQTQFLHQIKYTLNKTKLNKSFFLKNKYVYSQIPIQSIPVLSRDCGEILKKNSYKQIQKSFPHIKIKNTTFHQFFNEEDLWKNRKFSNSNLIKIQKENFKQISKNDINVQSFTNKQANKTEIKNRKFLFNLQKKKHKTYLILTNNNKSIISIDSSKNINIYCTHWFWLGKTIQYTNKINKNTAVPLSGMIIQIEKSKIIIRKAQSILFSPKALLHVYPFDIIEKNTIVISLFYQRLKTGDIVQGIPRIEQLFEARKTNQGEVLSNSLNVQAEKIFSYYIQKYNFVDAAKYSLEKIQQIIVNNVQKVYKSQGVSIADKHLEIIIRQMTSKVKIIQGGQTNLLPGEIVDLDWIEIINQNIENHKATYVPIILGITRKSLETKSFLSEASFQETTKVLARSAIQRKTDFLKGLKENVILGHVIPAGTGCFISTKTNDSTKLYKEIFNYIDCKYYETEQYESYVSFREIFLTYTKNLTKTNF